MPKARRVGLRRSLFRVSLQGGSKYRPRAATSPSNYFLAFFLAAFLWAFFFGSSFLNSSFLLLGHSPSSKKSFGEIRLGDLQVTIV